MWTAVLCVVTLPSVPCRLLERLGSGESDKWMGKCAGVQQGEGRCMEKWGREFECAGMQWGRVHTRRRRGEGAGGGIR